ncbi:recombinase family protein [Streptomyces sp. DH18]|uniref:recombinase family protein n=1 Tax=Streptomyces sp. DH18 TaxID=3040126 RepID=UPI002442B985|nr:recombinase family protein [Streptomyces sp. DH18]MDG9687862.1 recombinase family protein [Streptomyces sp. DH18]
MRGLGTPSGHLRGPGRTWQPGPDLAVCAALARAGDRIGYARVSSKGQDLAGQVRLLKKANCVRIYVERIGTREKIRPEYNDTLTVTTLDRLGRNMAKLITCAQDLAERDHRLEILGGPLAPPTGACCSGARQQILRPVTAAAGDPYPGRKGTESGPRAHHEGHGAPYGVQAPSPRGNRDA